MTAELIIFTPKQQATCSFCLKPKEQVAVLLGEEGCAFICSDCVAACTALMAEKDAA